MTDSSDLTKQINSSRGLLDAIREVMREFYYKAAPGSPVSADGAQPHYRETIWQGELLEQSDVQAQMSLLASLQHMSLALQDEGRRPAAFIVLLRAALEAVASASFLTSPDISIPERARRGLNEMLHAAFQQWKTLEDYGLHAEAAVKLQTLNSWLATAAGYSELGQINRAHERSRPKAPYVGADRPTIASMIDYLFPTGDNRRFGRWLYSVVSAPAHARPHGFAITGGLKLLPDGRQAIDQEAQLTDDSVTRFAITVISAIFTATKSVFTRYGWPIENIEEMTNDVFSHWVEVLDH